jgi:hypothetical protein
VISQTKHCSASFRERKICNKDLHNTWRSRSIRKQEAVGVKVEVFLQLYLKVLKDAEKRASRRVEKKNLVRI